MCTVSAAIGGISSVANFANQVSATNQYNQSVADAHRDASLAAQGKFEGEQRSLNADSKTALEQGYDAELAARDSIATARASSTVGGISMGDILSAERQKASRNAAKVRDFVSSAKDTYNVNTQAYKQEAQGRINSTPFQRGPSVLNLGLDIAGKIADPDFGWSSKDNFFKKK